MNIIFLYFIIMVKIVKNTLLNYLPEDITIEQEVNPERIFKIHEKPLKKGYVTYLMQRDIRLCDNFALQYAMQKSYELDLPLKIFLVQPDCLWGLKKQFLESQISLVVGNLRKNKFDYQVIQEKDVINVISKIETGLLVVEFNPLFDKKKLKDLDFSILEVDAHNIVPSRFLSGKQEYSAATIRRKIYHNIYPFFTRFDNSLQIYTEADEVLEKFIKDKLTNYAKYKNYPEKNVLSGLSKYLNLGFISVQKIALEVIKSSVSDLNKETFLEELIIRAQLADNFCAYCQNYKSLNCVPDWAKKSLNLHKNDLRVHLYSKMEFENAKTEDILWNAAQRQLTSEGVIHGYLRMYWAKKILEWSESAEKALDVAIYLNDKYALDAPSSNGYVGILWAIGGLHDRAFRDFSVTGKIRRMTYNSMKKKFNTKKYVEKYL